MSDPQSRPRDGDRKRAVEQVDAAYADGRITAADRALRVGNVESAATLGELDLVVRDLKPEPGGQLLPEWLEQAQPQTQPQNQLQNRAQMAPPPPPPPPPPGPAQPGSAQPGSAQHSQTFRVTRPRRPATGFRIGVMVVVGLMVLLSVGGSLLVANIADNGSVDTGIGPFEFDDPIDLPTTGPIASPAAPVDKLALTEAGLRWFVGRYADEFGTTRALQVVIWADRASVDLPVQGGRRQKSWAYDDGEFAAYGSVTTNARGSSVIDLRQLRLKPLVANIRRAKRTLGVEQPETVYVIIEDDTFGDGPEAHIYVSNKYNESGYLATTFGGRVVRSYPFQG